MSTTEVSAPAAVEAEVFPGMFSFRDALDRAAAQAFDQGQVDDPGIRSIIHAEGRPLVLLLVRKRVITEAVKQGLLTQEQARTPGAVDWNALLAFLQGLMPIILAFIHGLGG